MMLFSPESHEPLTGTAWNADRVRSAIAGVEAEFEGGWPVHPAADHESLRTKRLRSVYMGGAGVVDALHRLARRDFVELSRDYVPYLEESAVAPMDWSDTDGTRSLSSPIPDCQVGYHRRMIRKACTGCGCDQCPCPDCSSKR